MKNKSEYVKKMVLDYPNCDFPPEQLKKDFPFITYDEAIDVFISYYQVVDMPVAAAPMAIQATNKIFDGIIGIM